MQNRALMYVIGAVVVVILGVGAWMLVGKGGGPATPTGGGAATTTTTTQSAQQLTINDALAMQGSHMCTVTSETISGNSSGTVYIANGMLRGDFTSMMGSTTYTGHVVVKDKTNYFWTDSPAQGFKMPLSTSTASAQGSNQAIDPNVHMSYNCTDWSTDATKFDLPKNITFRELPSVNTTPSSSSNLSPQCSACDQLPAAAKAQCRTALKCK